MAAKKAITTKIGNLSDNSLLATLLVISTLLVAVSVILSRLWIGDIRFNNKVISKKHQANNTLEQNVAALPDLQQNFDNLKSRGPQPELVLEALPAGEEFSALAKNLEAVASLARAQLLSVVRAGEAAVPADAPNRTDPIPLSVQASVVGTYPELQDFLVLLEQNVRPIQVNKFTLNGVDPTVTLTLDLTTWWQPATSVEGVMEEVTE